MKNQNFSQKLNVRLSKSGAVLVIKDERGTTVLVNTNLIKHALGIAYTKKDGTHKTIAQIHAEQARAERAYSEVVNSRE